MGDFITYACDGLEDLKEGRDWIESHKITPSDREGKIIYSFRCVWPDEAECLEVAQYLHKCAEELKKNKTLFVQVDMLRSDHQSRSQTEKNFSNLIQQFFNSIESIVDNEFKTAIVCADSHVSAMWMSPLHVLTWLVIPAFALKVNTFIETTSESSYVFHLFEEVCSKVGPWIKITNQPEEKSPVTFVHHGSAHMFILEDADIHSAVSVIVEYLWNMKDKELCELTEVYVQESVYSKFSFLLTKKLAVKAGNCKWVKNCSGELQSYTKYKEYIERAVSVATSKGIEVCKPWDHTEIFVPTVIFGKVQRKQADILLPVVCVESFRTIDEGISLSEKSQKIQFASIWTESGPTAQYTAGQLQANLVWVNAYGLINTKVPFHLTVSQGDCIGCIRGCCFSGHKWLSSIWQCHHVPASLGFGKSVKENIDVKSLYKLAEQSTVKWGRASSNSRCEALLNMAYSINSNKEQYAKFLETSDCLEECIKLLYSFAYKCKENSSSRNINNMLSITTCKPLGVVTIYCTPQSKIVDYVRLIIGLIAYGNSVVLIHATNDRLFEGVKSFFQHIDLPKGSVNFLRYDCLSTTKDLLHGKSPFWLYPHGSHIIDHNIIQTAFTLDITSFNETVFKWFTEPKSVIVPSK